MNLKNAIQAQQLSIGYQSKKKEVVIRNNINFTIRIGELVGIVGANGIGKSTLINTITKQLSPLSGSIQINNKELTKLSTTSLATHVSMVFSNHEIHHNLSVYEVIALGRQPYTNWLGNITPQDKTAIDYAIEVLKIGALVNKKCTELSDGQLQKVMLARAIAQDTPIIILDEPTTHLDLYHKVYILKLLQRLTKQTQKTILFSSHEINVALKLCDAMLVMGSEKTYYGTPHELIAYNAFDQLFPADLIEFNKETKSFVIK